MKKGKKILIGAVGMIGAGLMTAAGYVVFNTTRAVPEYGVPHSEYYYSHEFNGQFTLYAGSNLNAAQISSLISTIKASNAKSDADGEEDEYFVKYTGPSSVELRNDKKYKVELKYNNKGLVCEVIVTEDNRQ